MRLVLEAQFSRRSSSLIGCRGGRAPRPVPMALFEIPRAICLSACDVYTAHSPNHSPRRLWQKKRQICEQLSRITHHVTSFRYRTPAAASIPLKAVAPPLAHARSFLSSESVSLFSLAYVPADGAKNKMEAIRHFLSFPL